MKNLSQDKIIQKIEDEFRVPERVADKVRNIAEKTKGGCVLCAMVGFADTTFVKSSPQ